MKHAEPKRPRVKLAPDAYEQLRLVVLQRDNWRCQNCGRHENLQVHHKKMRGQGGDDSDMNLITLCYSCHANEHARR
jgi:5-methylcytosine-specific restriction endonuclease McrA